MFQLGIKQMKYHPQSRGALERFHQTLKNMLWAYLLTREGLPLLLYAVRESVQESLGFSPFELVPTWPIEVSQGSVAGWRGFRWSFYTHFRCARQIAWGANDLTQQKLKDSQGKMKTWYDRIWTFHPGDQVLVLLPIHRSSLQPWYCGSYTAEKKASDVGHVICTQGRRKTKWLCLPNGMTVYWLL